MTQRAIRVPKIQYNRAKKLQVQYKKEGMSVPLWKCLQIVKEEYGQTTSDPFKRFRL